MAGTLEIHDSRGRWHYNLNGDVVIIGSGPDADLVIEDDSTVSEVHARLERAGSVWLVQDWGSTNGTHWRGRRINAAHRLSHGDDIVLGRTKLVYLDKASERKPGTEPLDELPRLTPTEKDVLVELCRPMVTSGSMFIPPTPTRVIAERRGVGRPAVQAVLSQLYDKFGIYGHPDDETDRRTRLANEAVQRGVIGPNDYKEP
jgi:pSer/pThr/pTyr-binding forkhead associated (FHA) protein